MDITTIMSFIEQAIKKTKEKELNWLVLNNDSSIKPLPCNESSTIIQNTGEYLLESSSYIAKYKTGELFLLVYSSHFNLMIETPPSGCTLSLRMQDSKSKYAVEVCNSDINADVSTQLIRLYNLIDKASSSVSALIDDFLNS